MSLGRVVLPAEHGSWSFLAEPLVLGLIVAPSWAAALIALAAIAGFLARTPLRLLVGDRRHGKRYPRTVVAGRAFAALALLAALAIAAAIAITPHRFLLPLALGLPLAAFVLAQDLAQRGRAAAAELVAPLALGAITPAMVMAAGMPFGFALAMWALVAARAIPTVLFVRARLRLDRGEAPGTGLVLAAHLAALAAAFALRLRGLAPWTSVIALASMLLLAAGGLAPNRPRMTARRLGAWEAALGGAYVIVTGLGWRLGR